MNRLSDIAMGLLGLGTIVMGVGYWFTNQSRISFNSSKNVEEFRETIEGMSAGASIMMAGAFIMGGGILLTVFTAISNPSGGHTRNADTDHAGGKD